MASAVSSDHSLGELYPVNFLGFLCRQLHPFPSTFIRGGMKVLQRYLQGKACELLYYAPTSAKVFNRSWWRPIGLLQQRLQRASARVQVPLSSH